MEIKLIEDKQSNLSVHIIYPVMDDRVNQLIHIIKGFDNRIVAMDDNKNILLCGEDIFYIESVERKTFLYTHNAVYRSPKKLYQFFGELADNGFVQVSKSCLLNLNKLDSVKVLLNSRLEATLVNGEKVIISRRYIPAIKQWLDKGVCL